MRHRFLATSLAVIIVALVGLAQNVHAGPAAYVTNSAANTVSVIDATTATVVKTLNVGTNPFGVAVDLPGNQVFVTNRGSNTVSIIDMGTNTVIGTVPVGAGPYGIAIDSA